MMAETRRPGRSSPRTFSATTPRVIETTPRVSAQRLIFPSTGPTDLAQFNQVGSGDYGDWYSYYGGVVPQVQDAFSPPGTNPNLGVALRALDVLGYHLVS